MVKKFNWFNITSDAAGWMILLPLLTMFLFRYLIFVFQTSSSSDTYIRQ